MVRVIKKIGITIAVLLLALCVFIFFYMQQASFGKVPAGERLERVKASKQFVDNSFANLSPTVMMAPDASYTKIMLRMFKKDPLREPSAILPAKQAQFTVPTDKPVITWFGHSTYLIQVNGINILMDPVFSERASFAQYIGPAAYPAAINYKLEDLPRIDMIIISHDHYDHLDYNTILKLKNSVKHFYVPLGVGSHLEYWGVPVANITELDWWQSTAMPAGMELTATPARHFSGRGFIRNKTLWASFVLNTGKHNIYLGGDSGYDTHFKAIGEKFGPFDIAMLENGQYDAQWPYIHMMPEQTVQASVDLKAKVLFPVHWGKFTLAVHPWNEPAIRVTNKAKELNVQVTTPRIGEQIILDSLYPADKWWYL